jgi:hypothetical protein
MAYFQTKNPNLGQFWGVLKWKMLLYFMSIWSILRLFGILCGYLGYYVAIWDILWPFGIFCGNLVYFTVIWYILR